MINLFNTLDTDGEGFEVDHDPRLLMLHVSMKASENIVVLNTREETRVDFNSSTQNTRMLTVYENTTISVEISHNTTAKCLDVRTVFLTTIQHSSTCLYIQKNVPND